MSEKTAKLDSATMGRRDVLKKGAAAGAIVWTTPLVLSRNAWAEGGGTAKCRPTIALQCIAYDCQQGNKRWPGIRVLAGPCSCADTTLQPAVCVKFGTITSSCEASVAYGEGTLCKPLQVPPIVADIKLSTGNWECVDENYQIFFGKARAGGGAIPEVSNGCTIDFRVAVWAGGCPDADTPDGAFNCQTFDVHLVWDNPNNTIDSCINGVVGPPSTITAASAANSMCTGVVAQPCDCD